MTRLSGRRVLVTRAAHQAGKLSDALRALGAEPVEVPVLEIRPPVSFEPLDQALRQFNIYDWLILTSANTVRALVERAPELGTGLALPSTMKVAAVGDATAAAARKAGFAVDLVPESYVAESLLDALSGRVSGQRVLLARAAIARDVIPIVLRQAGADVTVVDAYCNVMPESAPEQLRTALATGIDAATFTSSSSASHLAEAARAAEIEFPFAGVAAVSIGPVTSQTLRELGWEPAAEAGVSDVPGLVEAVSTFLSKSRRLHKKNCYRTLMPLILDNILVFLWRVIADAVRSSICQKWPIVKGSIDHIDSPERGAYPYTEIHYCYSVKGVDYDSRCLRGFWLCDSANDYAKRYVKLTSLQIRYCSQEPSRSYILDRDQPS